MATGMNTTSTAPTASTAGGGGGEQRPRSLREQAYAAIKQRIITFRYEPGHYLNENSVSKDLGIGRTPVHQALNRLMLEGLVEVIPRKGVIVKPVSLHEVKQIVEARLGVEPYAVRIAVDRAHAHHLERLREILDTATSALKDRDVERLMELDRDFHGTIAAATGNPVLSEVLSNLHDRSLRLWFISLNDQKHLLGVQSEHQEIFDAICHRDADLAAERMSAHIQAFGDNVSQQI